jgi:hypothetical protein
MVNNKVDALRQTSVGVVDYVDNGESKTMVFRGPPASSDDSSIR